jgi:hypothetical protein
MSLFLDLRALPTGGFAVTDWHDIKVVETISGQLFSWPQATFDARVRGRDLVVATHGFNVSGDAGVQSLGDWEPLCQIAPSAVYVGVLWPGDSRFVPVIDYPIEGSVAVASGKLLADFLNRYAGGAGTISLVSHSLGARVLLETVRHLDLHVHRALIMAGAIEDDALTNEYRDVLPKIDRVMTLSSESDWVLQYAFPTGNLVRDVLDADHPYLAKALGRDGPRTMAGLSGQCVPWQIPNGWGYVHGDYLPDGPGGITFPFPPAMGAPGPNLPAPKPAPPPWKPGWSACALRTFLE